MAARKNPTMRVGNYAAPVDTAGMDDSFKVFTGGGLGKMSKIESSFLKGAKNPDTAKEAIRRTRRANRGL